MRDFKGMKRQRGRNRSGGGGGGGGGKPSHNVNRAFDSNGPDNVKIRGHAQHVYEKYQQLARDASASGDRVLAENYQQHAEHYFRILRSLQPHRSASEIMGRDALASGFDIDFEDESEGEGEGEAAAEAPEGGQPGQGEERGEGRGERQDFRGENRENRENRQDRQDRPRRDRFEGRRDDRGPREGGGRYGEDRGGYGQRGDEPRGEQPQRETGPEAEGERVEEGSALLRSEDGGVSQAPAFLQAAAAPAGEEGEPRRRTRTRRRPRSFEGEVGGGEPPGEGSDEG
jgi:hypothetical protein